MSEPTPEQDARVRRLLADARHDEPVPDDVVARLDAVLAELRVGEAEPPPEVVDLAARRRRLRVRAATGLVAAAVVVVAGVVGVQQLRQGSGVDAASSSAGSSDRAARDHASSDSAGLGAAVSPAQRRAYAAARAPRVRAGHFAADVARVRLGGAGPLAPGADTLSMAVDACAPSGAGAGTRLPVRYDGVPAVLVLRPVVAGRQAVDLYACGGDGPLRSVDLPAR